MGPLGEAAVAILAGARTPASRSPWPSTSAPRQGARRRAQGRRGLRGRQVARELLRARGRTRQEPVAEDMLDLVFRHLGAQGGRDVGGDHGFTFAERHKKEGCVYDYPSEEQAIIDALARGVPSSGARWPSASPWRRSSWRRAARSGSAPEGRAGDSRGAVVSNASVVRWKTPARGGEARARDARRRRAHRVHAPLRIVRAPPPGHRRRGFTPAEGTAFTSS